jgi:hypothetical protein
MTTEDPTYYRLQGAAPTATEANYLNHPEEGWVPVLNGRADIGKSQVIIVLGRKKDSRYDSRYELDYSDSVDIIVNRETAHSLVGIEFDDPERDIEAADDLVEAENLAEFQVEN